ncbi:MAG: DUF6754 domain-containing protein [Armatimonadota bacterium]|jgi:hypothetical protein
MNALRLCTIGLCVLMAASVCVAQTVVPSNVQAVDDQEEPRGVQMTLTWEPPERPLELRGLEPVGQRILLREVGGGWQRGPVVPLGATSTPVGGLKPWPWPRWELGVTIEYQFPPPDAPLARAPGFSATVAPVIEAAIVGPVRPEGTWFNPQYTNILALSVLICVIVIVTIYRVRGRAEDVYIRPIAGLEAVNDAIGRATEMGKPIVYVSGLSGIGSISTIASMLILGHLSRRSAAYETEILVPCNDPLVMTTEREIVRQAYTEAGKPDAYRPDNIFFVTESQFGYVAAVDGIMLREKPAACFYMGYFFAEALILAETGNETGAIQIAGTDADTQLPFFITACDYTLMGEELYAASAYLSRQPLLVAQLRGQDIAKFIIAVALVAGVAAATYASVATGWLADAARAFVQWFGV